MMLKDEMGKTFGKLKVIGSDSSGAKYRWLCECCCGKKTLVPGYKLRSGHTRSCGCSKKEYIIKKRCEFGVSLKEMPEYICWMSMNQRCYDTNMDKYKDYGGRGITVCDKWRHDFPAFYKDMGKRISLKYTLDRINTNGNYEPSNCKWSTPSEQMLNRRTPVDNTSGTKGVYLDKRSGSWRSILFLNKKRIELGTFKIKQDAVRARIEAEIKYLGKMSPY